MDHFWMHADKVHTALDFQPFNVLRKLLLTHSQAWIPADVVRRSLRNDGLVEKNMVVRTFEGHGFKCQDKENAVSDSKDAT